MVGERSLLNTQYYKDMLDTSITWTNEFLVKTSKWQFGSLNSEGTDIGTRLNTDLELLYDLTIDNSTGQCSCTIGGDCEKATDSYDLVETYAEVSVFSILKMYFPMQDIFRNCTILSNSNPKNMKE